ncbi:MAG TPA: hypothetical protein VF601_02395 [Beijerinckiaceae bacterium]|jgi:hypothetical protein
MKLRLTIDEQTLVLELAAAVKLFGKERLMEFAEGRWSPFVTCGPTEPAPAQTIDLTELGMDQIRDLLNVLPKRVINFPEYVRDEIERLQNE